MKIHLVAKPIKFNLNTYLNKGFELYKKDMGTFLFAFLFLLILSFIPGINLMAMANFFKICRKINFGEKAQATEVFDFTQWQVFVKLFLAIFLGVIILEAPFIALIYIMDHSETSALSTIITIIYGIFLFIVLMIISLKAYYVMGLMALEGVTSIKKAWNISKIMSKNNLLMIFLYTFLVGLIGQLGFFACFFGLFISIPLTYVLRYISFEEAIAQLKNTEA